MMPINNATLQTVEIQSGSTVTVSAAYKERLGPFQAIGRINSMFSKKVEVTDIFDILDKVSKSAYSLFNQIKNNRNPTTNIACLPKESLSKSQRVMYNKRLKELKNFNLIKKAVTIDKREPIKKNSFMINPRLIKCPDNQDKALSMWEILK